MTDSIRVKRSLTLGVVMLTCSMPALADDFTGAVNWARPQGRIGDDLFSMNLFQYPRPEVVASPAYREGVRYLKPALLRLHNAGTTRNTGGASLVDPVAKDWDFEKIGIVLGHLKDIPGERVFNIVHFSSWLDTNGDKLLDEDKFDEFAKFCADIVRYTNKTTPGTYIKYWEVTNERDQLYGDAGRIQELAEAFNRGSRSQPYATPIGSIAPW